jgi:predicted aminopeptidase
VDTVIHELTHGAYYAPGQAAFNESYASFVGGRGAEAFFRLRGDTAAAREAARRWDDARRLGAFWTALARSLDSAYAAADARGAASGRARTDPAAVRARIAAADGVYARARAALVDSVAPTLATLPAGWARRTPLDNATLLARLVYARDLDLFDAVWAREGRDLRRAARRVEALVRARADDPYAAVADWLAAR